MPQDADVLALVLELFHFDDLRESGYAFDERVFDRLAHAPCKSHELRGGERLVVKEHHQVLEEGAPDRRDGLVCEVSPEIHPENPGAKRTGKARDLHAYCSRLTFRRLRTQR